ncbi:MAG: hypothetical protein KBG20_03055 [Caldilineaceae bacterium]|nr:hypothetical protein [Caldilineaceae bacterium]MBP8107731.1 hypothetical protein [Caldilineaceae bacterium]MBP8122850.1 hypothetical protein [Caldilineaceae bacterium]MBP9071244.1 hypothetical protein [Caldilineaceae bacterium]
MPRSTTTALTLAALSGALLTGYVFTQMAPILSTGRLDLAALLLLFGGIMLMITGLVGLLALGLSRRWPVLAGRGGLSRYKAVRTRSRTQAAIRQGLLAGVVAAALLVLALTGWLDLSIALVIVVLAGLVESFVQSRG